MSTGKKPAARILPLAEEHHADAAALVAARYRVQRLSEPLLPAQFEDPVEILPRVAKFASKGPGVAAVREGCLAGFVVAYLTFREKMQLSAIPAMDAMASAALLYYLFSLALKLRAKERPAAI